VSSAYYYNPRSKAIAPLAETSEQTYGLSEKALVLLLATRVRDSPGEAFLQDFVDREIVPELKRRRDESSSPFYFDVPLMLEAAQRYLRPDQVPAPPGESECTLACRRSRSRRGNASCVEREFRGGSRAASTAMIYGSGALRGPPARFRRPADRPTQTQAHAPSLRKASATSEENMNAPKRR